uniref:HhH-GPD superfamily base excision DNA repair protein n=1 Tax=Pithovirus LCPAC406 TaxID=2506599 RepID=A0A481ZI46_9VIRU|nr:MAG: HhH-GPD superfamily base excision DNA repair protein [Pithovirus LCPAC406]
MVEQITKILDKHYPNPTTEIKWTNKFTLCVAMTLSPMCKDSTVNKITDKLHEEGLFTPKAIFLNRDRVAEILSPAGFKKKVGYVMTIAERFKDGEDPSTFKELKSFKGMGSKIASLIQACLGQIPDRFAVDTHVKRCSKRWGLTEETNVNRISRDLENLFDKSEWAKRHFQIVAYGKEKCKARGHVSCEICDLF